MAQNKYFDFNGMKYYDTKLKAWVTAADAQVLTDAKAYADGLAPNYDAAGTAQTKVDALANGAVAANTAAIAKLNGDATTDGSVAKAVADAKNAIDTDIDAVEAKADAAQAAADKAQGEVDALETYVGTLPDGTSATSVVDYVNVKTAGIATDAALSELQGQLTAVQGDVNTIKGDYLKDEDKTELQDQITANTSAINAIEDDYLKAADKNELQGNIDAKADQSALDAEIARAKAAEEKNAADIALILDNPDTAAVDSIKEFVTYVEEHGEVATGLQTQITKNKDDIAAMDTAYKAADTALDNRVKALEDIDHEAYQAADNALNEALTAEIAKKANQTAVDAMDAAYKAADTALDNRLKAVESAVGESGSVSDDIATAKQEAIDAAVAAAATDATTKANQALTDAKAYTDTEVDRVEANVAQNTTDISSLKTRMDTAENDIDALEAAIGDGGSVTVAIAEAKKAGTDAQTYAEGVNTAVTNLTSRVAQNESDISAHGDRLTALESKVGDGFTAITNQEIDSLFTV